MFGSVDTAYEMGAAAVGATIYFGSSESDRHIQEISQAFEYAHNLGMATILWCYLRNKEFHKDDTNYETSADLTGQANHLGVTIKADIIKQKQPTSNYGFREIGFCKTDDRVYTDLTSDHPIDLTRCQVINSFCAKTPISFPIFGTGCYAYQKNTHLHK